MDLTVGKLREILKDESLTDDMILATLKFGGQNFDTFTDVKRLLVLKDESSNKNWDGKTYLAINQQGSHFTGNGSQFGLKFTGKHFDELTNP